MSMPANKAAPDGNIMIGGSDLLPRHRVFRTRDLEHARRHNHNVFVEHVLDYLPRERHLDFRHRQAKLGSITMELVCWISASRPPILDPRSPRGRLRENVTH
jgi:hypothetical protein